MDPNAALRELRELMQGMATRGDRVLVTIKRVEELDRMVELFTALDGWLSGGGFPPEEWREGPDAESEEFERNRRTELFVPDEEDK